MVRIIVLALALSAAGFAPALAWDTTPWNTTPFDQASGMSAAQRTKIGATEARIMTMPATAKTQANKDIVSSSQGKSCNINVGNATAPANGNTDVMTNVKVTGDIINICR